MGNGTNRIAKFLLPAVLGMTAGAVDVTGFLALGGLFTAHITGNLVILAAHYITGSFGEIAPLLSVPVFVVVLGVITVMFIRKPTPFTHARCLLYKRFCLHHAWPLASGSVLSPIRTVAWRYLQACLE
jgi:uncharacterized membrane protein YoaK (UPF0700 family)